jgi:HK97 family phage major capsid protein
MKKSSFLTILAVVAFAALAFAGGAIAAPSDLLLHPAWLQPDSLNAGHLLAFAGAGTIKQLNALRAKRKTLVDAMTALTGAAEARDDGMLTADERTQFDAHAKTIDEIDADITRVQKNIDTTRTGTAVTVPDGNPTVTDNGAADPRGGFRSFGEFAVSVRSAGVAAAQGYQFRDERLNLEANAPGSNVANESSGTDGGFLVPVEYSRNIFTASQNQVDALLPYTDSTPVEGNSMAFPVDETTPWGSTGIKAYWTNEAAEMAKSKPAFDPAVLRLQKLTCLVPITDELSADASAIGSYITAQAPLAITWKTNEALWSGDGAGKPKGFYGSGAMVSVAKEAGQAAASVVRQNIIKMRARMTPASYRRAIWMINPDALPQLDELAYGQVGTNTAIYNPVGGDFGYGTLLGRPVMVTQHNATVGAQGDIALVDWKSYRTITKAGGIETATSMHLWFDLGLQAFRMVFRVAGQPAVTKAITPNNGSNTLSPFVVLDVRS